jgi:hypothetical protein
MNAIQLRLYAKLFSDAQEFRKSLSNKLRSNTSDPDAVDTFRQTTDDLEEMAKKTLLSVYRREVPEPIQQWQSNSLGVGEHLIARLLGEIGHPRIAEPWHWEGEGIGNRVIVQGEPYERSVSQLWQYCGHGKPSYRHKGMSKDEAMAGGNPHAKAVTWNIVNGIVKASVRKDENDERMSKSVYGQLYLDTKERYADRVHSAPCRGGVSAASPTGRSRCKVDARYADVGDPFSAGHINAIAMRRVGKEVLRDLWIVAA